ncbi:unnamed protein product, partial [Mesorhabditis spiculigera]
MAQVSDNESSKSSNSASSSGSAATMSVGYDPVWPPITIDLLDGEYMHDLKGPNQSKKTLTEFVNAMTDSDVYNVFFHYTTVIQRDPRKAISTYKKWPDQNRYTDIPCYDDTRVKVKHPTADHDYYHASYVAGYRAQAYILAQSPMPHNAEQWWHMIWQEKVPVIINMVPLDGVACPRYLPINTEKALTFGPFTIEASSHECVRGHYCATNIHVAKDGKEWRHLLHVICHDWDTRLGTPTRPTEVLNLLTDLNNAYEGLVEEAEGVGWLNREDKSPILVSCHTGVNRSATLVALDILCKRLEESIDDPDGPLIDVENTVLKLRTQRAMAVQRPEQYLFLHLAAFEFALRRRMLRDEDAQVGAISAFKLEITEDA